MRVSPGQLTPGCIIVQDVKGRTQRPIIPKNTIVQPVHIEVLKKFQIPYIEISHKRSDGTPFIPQQDTDTETEQPISNTPSPSSVILHTFEEQYLDAVQSYKEWYNSWQAGSAVDIQEVRRIMVPLLEKSVESKPDIFTLHHHSTAVDYMYHHGVATGLLSGYVASKMGYSYGEWIQVGLAGALADAGMARIDKRITSKEAALTETEYSQVKNHPALSYRMTEKIASLSKESKLAILQHHERMDGTGYPLGLHHDKIHMFSQILAVSDMYHAMTSERHYRERRSPFLVLEEMLQKQMGRYHQEVIQTLAKELTGYSIGTKVRLSDNSKADILFVDEQDPVRPIVQSNDSIINLKEHLDLYIEEVYE
ncbi:HD domain-containing phosphohydrolase [Halobacillus sp. ACCC02827]|uniref:HD-GYP domain-containing protein n=1 Tax=unclassified Halobacillus TaxID=2636472 RepID=UPI000783F32F|nr:MULTISPECIES: HD domain-containing phosphohydrolase [unclassified Halobacillus]WJE15830.1 HD domain-containing phosphohydrolase [Halobacillus sp. ACCC02827]